MKEIQGVRRRTWAEIDLDDAKKNFDTVRSALNKDVKLCCVIKANAYGHGAVKMAEFYQKMNADYLAVSNIEEALQLRKKNITIPILILGYTPEECAEVLARHKITQTVYSHAYGKRLAECAAQAGVRVTVHIKLDTGMGRIGFLCRRNAANELPQALEICQMPSLIPEGIFTHFAVADESRDGEAFTNEQLSQFLEGISYLEQRGIHFSLRHCANSAAIFDYPQAQLDMVRAGVVLYGLKPSERVVHLPPLAPILSLKSVISHIKMLSPGESVSYGRAYVARHAIRVATVPIGYADGFWRANGSKEVCLSVNGQEAPILGRICMDQLMLDVSKIDCKVGDIVTVLGADGRCSADAVAQRNRTVNYEVVCAIGERVPRAFLENGTICSWQDSIYTEDI